MVEGRELLESDRNSSLISDQEPAMKPLHLSGDILPLGEFKTQASRVLRQLHDSNRPVVITQNGRPAAVLISPEEFDRIQDHDRTGCGSWFAADSVELPLQG